MPQRAEQVGRRRAESNRPNSTKRGYGRRWRKARAAFLEKHPLCVKCLAEDVTEPSNEVDHIVPHEGEQDPLFWDQRNWQALCKTCHSQKTAREGGRRWRR